MAEHHKSDNDLAIEAKFKTAPDMATKIERLEAERAEMLEALRPFAEAILVEGQVIGLNREDFDRVRAILARADR